LNVTVVGVKKQCTVTSDTDASGSISFMLVRNAETDGIHRLLCCQMAVCAASTGILNRGSASVIQPPSAAALTLAEHSLNPIAFYEMSPYNLNIRAQQIAFNRIYLRQ
jgi:hypothetical protein